MSAALVMTVFALLFAIGGWVSFGNAPKPFAEAEGFFVSGIQLQTALLGLLSLGFLLWRGRLGPFLDRGLALIWHLARIFAVLPVIIVFLWASSRFLFGFSSFPPQHFFVSFSETWWMELALASFGLALVGGIPALLRWGGHVSIDLFTESVSPQFRLAIIRCGTVFLSLPFGWILLTKGTVFAARSWNQWEGSQNFGIEFVFLVKTLVPLLGFLIIVASGLCLQKPAQARGKAAAP